MQWFRLCLKPRASPDGRDWSLLEAAEGTDGSHKVDGLMYHIRKPGGKRKSRLE
jgi:hypothetical protein